MILRVVLLYLHCMTYLGAQKVMKRFNLSQRRVVSGLEDVNAIFSYVVTIEVETSDAAFITKFDGNRVIPVQVFRVCSGSLLTSTWVLTSALCTLKMISKVRYGDVTAPQNASDTFCKILKKIPHPGFRNLPSAKTGTENNIALLIIEKLPVKRAFARLGAMDYKTLIGFEAQIVGYGVNDTFLTTSSLQSPLKYAEVSIRKCPNLDSGPRICITGKCGQITFPGFGDAGGPLTFKGNIVGISSLERLFTVFYVPVSPYLTWIRVTIISNSNV